MDSVLCFQIRHLMGSRAGEPNWPLSLGSCAVRLGSLYRIISSRPIDFHGAHTAMTVCVDDIIGDLS